MIWLRAFLVLCLLGGNAATAEEAIDCNNLDDVDQYKQLQLDTAELVKKCVNKGFDPPLKWRPVAGRQVSLPGAGSTITHGQNAPEATPDRIGAPASVSNTKWGLSISMPPWQGFPCQLPGGISLCGGGGDGTGGAGGGGGCPPRDDSSGTFGEHIKLNSLASKSLPCGGTIALTSMSFSVTPGATNVAIADANEYTLKLYKLNTATNLFEHYDNAPLPQYLCKPKSDGSMEKSVDLLPPIPQLFAYSGATSNLVIRLQHKPEVKIYDPFDPDPDAEREKFLIVPVIGGAPKDLTGCASETTYYKTNPPPASDLDVIPVGGASGVGSSEDSCQVSTLYPDGASCSSVMLVVATDDPQLVHTPGVTAEFTPLNNNRGEVMVKSTANSMLMVGEGALIRIGSIGQKFTLPDGGVIPLRDGKFLKMDGPVDILGGGAGLTLGGGGQIHDAGGDKISEYSAGATVSPNADLPYLIKLNSRLILPAGLLFPGKPDGDLRMPVSTQ